VCAGCAIWKARFCTIGWIQRAGETAHLEFRAEAFNAFNHPQFVWPGNTIDNPGVGKMSGTSIDDREIQLALRLVFQETPPELFAINRFHFSVDPV